MGIVMAEIFKMRDQKRADSSSDATKALYNPKPQRPTAKLNKLQVVLRIFLGKEQNTTTEQIRELTKTKIPDREIKFMQI